MIDLDAYIARRLVKINIEEREIDILPLVKGMVINGEIVRRAVETIGPDSIGLTISPEGLEDLKKWSGDLQDIPLSTEDLVYLKGLEKFGETSLPPPEYMEALEISVENDLSLLALDMDEDKFSQMFVDTVSIFELRRRSLLPKKLKKREIIASTPEEYAEAWETLLSGNKGLAAMEQAREEHIADSIINCTSIHKKILVLIEYERSKGVISQLVGDAPLELV